jgi:hypothetical protein
MYYWPLQAGVLVIRIPPAKELGPWALTREGGEFVDKMGGFLGSRDSPLGQTNGHWMGACMAAIFPLSPGLWSQKNKGCQRADSTCWPV